MGRNKLHVPIPAALLESDADAYAIAVYAALKRHTDYGEETGAHPSDATLARLAGCSQRTVPKARAYLRKNGWIDWTRRDGDTNSYTVKNEPTDPPPRSEVEPMHDMQWSDSEQNVENSDLTPARDAEVGTQNADTTAPHAEVPPISEGTTAPGAEGGMHEVQTTEYPYTEDVTSSQLEASSLNPPGEAPTPPTPTTDWKERIDAIQAEMADDYCQSDIERRKVKAATQMIIEDPLANWRNPHTMDLIPEDDRPPLYRKALLDHFQKPAFSIPQSLKYRLMAELDPAHVPEDSEAAAARKRESKAKGAPTSDDPVNSRVAQMANPSPMPNGDGNPTDEQIKRAMAWGHQHPTEAKQLYHKAIEQMGEFYQILAQRNPGKAEGVAQQRFARLAIQEGVIE